MGNIKIDKKKLLRLLEDCNTGDAERDHIKADELLLLYIDDDEISRAFESIDKWYA